MDKMKIEKTVKGAYDAIARAGSSNFFAGLLLYTP